MGRRATSRRTRTRAPRAPRRRNVTCPGGRKFESQTTFAAALKRAHNAGAASAALGSDFTDFLCVQGLANRSPQVIAQLRAEFDRGAEANAARWRNPHGGGGGRGVSGTETNPAEDPNESVQDRSYREWAENFQRVQADPTAASEQDLRRAIGYLSHARASLIRRAQEAGRTVDPNVLAGYDNDQDYFMSLIKAHEQRRGQRNPEEEGGGGTGGGGGWLDGLDVEREGRHAGQETARAVGVSGWKAYRAMAPKYWGVWWKFHKEEVRLGTEYPAVTPAEAKRRWLAGFKEGVGGGSGRRNPARSLADVQAKISALVDQMDRSGNTRARAEKLRQLKEERDRLEGVEVMVYDDHTWEDEHRAAESARLAGLPPMRYNPPQPRYLDAGPQLSETPVGADGQARGPFRKVIPGAPVVVLQKGRGGRALVQADYYGVPLYGWVNAEDVVTGKRFEETHGYPPGLTSDRHSNPAAVADMTPGQINKELAKLDAEDSRYTHQMIEAGRGHERPSDYLNMTDPLSLKVRANYDRRMELVRAVQGDMGPGYHKYPEGWRHSRRRRYNPTEGEIYPYQGYLHSPGGGLDRGMFRTPAELDRWVQWTTGTLNKRTRKDWYVVTKTPEGSQRFDSPLKGGGTRRNPEGDAGRLYEEFHGRPSEETLLVETEVHEHDHLTALGDLTELVVETPTGLEVTVDFLKQEVLLCSSEDGRQLYFEGGDQSLDLSQFEMDGDEWVRDLMVLGKLVKTTYRTQKAFDKFKTIDYYHENGEESGVTPELLYDPISKLMRVAGGQYFVKPEGIVN